MRIYVLLMLKRWTEVLLMWPFVAYGRWLSRRNPLTVSYDLFVFVSDYSLGGAELVHANILECLPAKRVKLFFTRQSASPGLLQRFQQAGVDWTDISKDTDNKARYWRNFIWRGKCAGWINRQTVSPVVFNGQCNFAYKLLPHLRRNIRNVELIHVSEKKFSWVTFPYVSFLDCRIVVARQVMDDIKGYYREIGIPQKYADRFMVIPNKTELPSHPVSRSFSLPLKVYYAGRGGYQKRLPLIMEVARQAHRKGVPVEFHFAGDLEPELPADFATWGHYHGKINAGSDMSQFHRTMDILLLLSAFEGFPLTLMEAMANGVVPVSTAVSGIPEHIRHEINGLLLYRQQEDDLVKEALQQLERLTNDPDLLQKLSDESSQYAFRSFGGRQFCQAYQQVLLGK